MVPLTIVSGFAILALLLLLREYLLRKKAEKHREQYGVLLNLLPYRFLVTDRDGTILEVHDRGNPQAVHFKTVDDLPCHSLQDVKEVIEKSFQQIDPVIGTLEEDARYYFCRKIPREFFGKETVLWSSADCTKELNYQKDLRAQEQFFRQLLDTLPCGMLFFDDKGNISIANRHFEQMAEWRGSFRQTSNYLKNTILKDPVNGNDVPLPGCVDFKHLPVNGHYSLSIHTVSDKLINCSFAELPSERFHYLLCATDLTPALDNQEAIETEKRRFELTSDLLNCTSFLLNRKTGEIVGEKPTSNFWEVIGNRPIPIRRWVFAEDVEEYLAGWDRLLQGEVAEWQIKYRSNYSGILRYFQLAAKVDKRRNHDHFILVVIQELTEIERHMRELKEKSMLLQNVLELFPAPLFLKDISDGYRYCFSSEYFSKLCGKTPASIMGLTDYDLFPSHDIADCCRQSDMEADMSGKPQTTQERLPLPDETKTFQIIKFTYNDQRGHRMLFGMAMDISDALAYQQQLEEHSKMLLDVLEQLPVCILAKDIDDNFRYLIWNKELETRLGYSREQVIGKTDEESVIPIRDANQTHLSDLEAIRIGKPYSYDETRMTASGDWISFRSCKSVVKTGKYNLLVKASMPVADLKEIENDRTQMLTQLQTHTLGERIINHCLARLSVENDFQKAVAEMLAAMGKLLKADSCYILFFTDQGKNLSCPAYWNAKRTRDMDHMPNQYGDLFHDSRLLLSQTRQIAIDDTGSANDAKQKFAKSWHDVGVASLIHTAILHNGDVEGILCVEFHSLKHKASPAILKTLIDAARIVHIAREREHLLLETVSHTELQNQIINAMPIPTMVMDSNNYILHIGDKLREAMAQKGRETIPPVCDGLFCEKVGQCISQLALQTGETQEREVSLNGREGIVYAVPIVLANGSKHVVEYFVDMNDIRKDHKLLEQFAHNAQAKAEEKNLFAATMSHELRTPLNTLVGFADLLQDRNLPESEREDAIAAIGYVGKTLSELINDVLDFSKMESGKMEIYPELIDISGLIREIQAIFEQRLREKNLQSIVNLPACLPLLELDALRIRQVLMNILGNAIKYTEKGAVTLAVEFTPTSDRLGTLLFKISDTGIGMTPEDSKHIFDLFVQTGHGETHLNKGTGLGLAICKKLVHLMNGTISVNSNLGTGSVFTVEFSSVRYANVFPDTPEAEQSDFKDRPFEFSGKILFVDDEPMNLRVYEAMARKLEVSYFSASNGAEALHIIDNTNVAVVFTDIWLQGLSGIELTAEIRKKTESNPPKIIAVTGDSDIERLRSANLFDAVLLKPVTIECVRKVLQSIEEATVQSSERKC